jgi:DNA processing protein
MAVPGPVDSEQSRGTNQLIRDGARAVTCAEEVIEEIQGVAANPRPRLRAPSEPPMLALFDPTETVVFEALKSEPKHVDLLREETGLVPGVLLAKLLDLELRGVAEALPGKLFRRA